MLERSSIFRLLLALLLAVGSPACLCAAGSVRSDSGAMEGCNDCCNCCKTGEPGGCDDAAPDDASDKRKPHRDCSGTSVQAVAASPDVSISKAAVLSIPVVWWDFPAAERADIAAHVAILARRAILQPTTSLLRQHCALTV